jgi:hypothetical protein
MMLYHLSYLKLFPINQEWISQHVTILNSKLTVNHGEHQGMKLTGCIKQCNIWLLFVWDMIMCHSVSSLHRLKHTYCFPDFRSCLPSDAASYPRRSKCSITLLWKPQHLQCKTCDRQQTCGQGCNMHSLARFNGRKKCITQPQRGFCFKCHNEKANCTDICQTNCHCILSKAFQTSLHHTCYGADVETLALWQAETAPNQN